MVVCGIPLIVLWGLLLSLVVFIVNVVYTPILKVVIWLVNITLPVMEPLKVCIGSIMETCGHMCATCVKR